ncbi:hypothetical protein [Micromonospora sp. NPDC092111]|uniref:hypothetical protein n=1 Tax=Micromonospora sp. NPDC092111 TaxID=3364289 RepID=UPI003801E7C8
MDHVNLRTLDRLPGPVRADYLRIVERMVDEVTARPASVLSVPVLWLTLGPADTDDIRVERVDLGELYRRHGYAERFGHWVESAVRQRMAGGRCGALVCHDRMSGPVPGPLLGAMLGPRERHVHLHATHRDDPRAFWDTFPIRRRPLRRIRFAPEVRQQVAQARRAFPEPTG